MSAHRNSLSFSHLNHQLNPYLPHNSIILHYPILCLCYHWGYDDFQLLFGNKTFRRQNFRWQTFQRQTFRRQTFRWQACHWTFRRPSAAETSLNRVGGNLSPTRLFLGWAETYIWKLQHKLSGDSVLYTSYRRYHSKSIKRASDTSQFPLVPHGPLGPLIFPSCEARSNRSKDQAGTEIAKRS